MFKGYSIKHSEIYLKIQSKNFIFREIDLRNKEFLIILISYITPKNLKYDLNVLYSLSKDLKKFPFNLINSVRPQLLDQNS